MPCQIGITMNLERRKRQWKNKRPRLRNWRRLSTHRTKSAAQAMERKLAKKYGCNYHPGGAGPERATWYVYRFDY